MYFFRNILIHISSSLLINQFLTLVIISIWFKERDSFIIDLLYVLFYSILFKLPRLGLSKLYFCHGKTLQPPPNHNVEHNWSIFFRITWKDKWKLIIESLYFLFSFWNQYIAGSYCIKKIKYIFTIIKGSFFPSWK